MKTITLSFYDNRPAAHVAGTVYGFIAVNPESSALMRDEFRSTISCDGMEYWTLEQVATLSRTLERDMVLQIVR
jgi:hypothetical protein